MYLRKKAPKSLKVLRLQKYNFKSSGVFCVSFTSPFCTSYNRKQALFKRSCKAGWYAKQQPDSFESPRANSRDSLVSASLRESGTAICIALLIKINYTRLYLSELQVPHIGTKCSVGGNCTEIFNVNSEFNFLYRDRALVLLY